MLAKAAVKELEFMAGRVLINATISIFVNCLLVIVSPSKFVDDLRMQMPFCALRGLRDVNFAVVGLIWAI